MADLERIGREEVDAVGLDELREGILENAREKARAIAKEEERETSRLLSEAESHKKVVVEKARSEAKEIANEERREMVANAQLEAKREMAKARDELVASVADDVRKEFFRAAKAKGYAERLRKMVEGAKKELGGEVVVHVSKEDRKLLPEIKGAKVDEKPIECEGGAIIVSKDGLVRIDATLEALFAEKEDRVRQELTKALFKK